MPEPLPLVGINHLGVLTTRLEESRRFYRDVLGFREVKRPNFDFPGAWLHGHNLTIHLIVDPSAPSPEGPLRGRVSHTAFHVDDIDSIENRLREHGIEFRVGRVADTDIKQIFFRDPSGYFIEVAKYPPTPEYID